MAKAKKIEMTVDEAKEFYAAFLADPDRMGGGDEVRDKYYAAADIISKAESKARKEREAARKAERQAAREAKAAAKRARCTREQTRGTCQICGRDVAVDPITFAAAKHGYTVEHGYFNGECAGSDAAAYEVSSDNLVEFFFGVVLRIRANIAAKVEFYSHPEAIGTVTRIAKHATRTTAEERVTLRQAEYPKVISPSYTRTWADEIKFNEFETATRELSNFDWQTSTYAPRIVQWQYRPERLRVVMVEG